MNNNDKLKTFIRARKAAGDSFFESISGADIASANRGTLNQWLDDGGFNPAEIIANHVDEPATPATPATPANAPQPATGNATAETALTALQTALTALGGIPGGGINRDDLDTLKAEIIAEITPPARELVIRIGDKPAKSTAGMHKTFPDLLTIAACREHALLVGPAGSFKTTAAKHVAEALELPFSSISVCQQTSAVAFLGYLNAMGEYVPTEFRQRYEHGGIFLLDEMDNGNANVLAVLNSATANGECAFADGMVKKHEDFVLIASANTFGTGANAQYVGRCQLDAATLDRFASLQWDYDEELEMSLAGDADWCRHVQSLRASAARLGSRVVISPRATFRGCKLLAAGMARETVERVSLWKGIDPAERTKIEAGAR